MKPFFATFFSLIILLTSNKASAQTNDDVHAFVKEGTQLSAEKKYPEAIEKYRQALKIDSSYLFAEYQLALSLSAMDRNDEAIPYLKKIVAANTNFNSAAYDLLGLIYFRKKQYANSETYAIEAIKANPQYATDQRMYALVAFHQNKRAAALLGFCSFILLEPNTARSAEAYGNIQHILQGGELKPEPGVANQQANDADTQALNQAITKAVADGGKEKHASPADLLAAQLKGIFTTVGQLAEKQTGNDFFRQYLAAYFYKMTQSPVMPAFAHLISQSTPESAKWITEHPKDMDDLHSWIKSTERN